MTTGRLRRLILVALLVATLAPVAATSPAPVAAQQDADTRAWLALGDSYASGEGIPGTVPESRQAPGGGRGSQGRHCERATGEGTDATAWAVGAYDATRAELGVDEIAFVACTGAISDEIAGQIGEAQDSLDRDRWDIVTLGIGGNNIRFAEILKGCLDVANAWDVFDLTPGCDVTEQQLERRVDMLVGTRDIDRREYAGRSALPEVLDTVAAYVVSGGDVIVTGYPHLIEEVDRWSGWRQRVMGHCAGIKDYDIGMLRSATGYLNEQLGRAVLDADRRHRDDGVRFHFVDISQDPYEYSDDAGSRHGLCSDDPWLNGVTTGIASGDWWELDRSFHPRQEGHTNTARVVATLLHNEITFDDGVGLSSDEIAGRAVCSPGCTATGTIAFDHPTWGPSYLVTTEPASGSLGEATITALDARGEVRWSYRHTSMYAMSPVGVPDSYSGVDPLVDRAVDANGHLFVLYNPGRYNGIIVLAPTQDGFEDFGSLPAPDDYQGAFYYAEVIGATDDGAFVIEGSANDCIPSCAGGAVTSVQYTFDGSDYSPT